jgi:hypothetical protein
MSHPLKQPLRAANLTNAPSVARTPGRAAGLTMIEIMLAVVVLTIGIMGVLSNIPTLNSARNLAIEMAQAQQIAAIMSERLMGTAWNDLGGQNSGNQWSLPRYAPDPDGDGTTVTTLNPPLKDNNAASANDDLVGLGILSQKSGVPDLKVYVEYYDGTAILGGVGSAVTPPTDRATFYARITNGTGVTNRMTTFSVSSGTSTTNNTVIRILITWRESANGVAALRHELFLARKQ